MADLHGEAGASNRAERGAETAKEAARESEEAGKADAGLGLKWGARRGRFYMTGTQALVKLLLMQAERDRAAGLDTAGFVSGYRGSPLGGLDHALWRAKGELGAAGVAFEPGLNEELAATMVWGSQQAPMSPGFGKDGVFGMWYAKGPGVDRAMDALRHANAAGTSEFGGVLAIAGDDHAARSSTMPHQSDHMFMGAMMPTLAPSDPQEFIDLGLHGYALSRYCGCWVGMLAVADTVESGCVVDVDPARVSTRAPTPEEHSLPEGGLSIRWPDDRHVQERRLQDAKVYAALAYAKRNNLNAIHGPRGPARLGIVSCGKAWRDTLQALDDLGLDEAARARLGIRLLKLGMSWPLEPSVVKEFAEGMDEILVVEEKRPIVEYLIKEQLYNWEGHRRPVVVGKFDERGEWSSPRADWLLPAHGELTPAKVALAIASRVRSWGDLGEARGKLESWADFLAARARSPAVAVDALARAPHYCAGCPHNRSTKVPEGSRALAGIGCHYMSTWIQERTETVSQMGGEGVGWAGMMRFTSERHVFANLGDGTFWHSGSLAIRQSVAAKANMTYKLLHNDAVAMTGGQAVEGAPGPARMLWSIHAEGVASIDVVAEDLARWREWSIQGALPPGTRMHPREAFEAVQKSLVEAPGVTVLFFDQTCATEKRRRRKRGALPKAPRRAWINPDVCEGCGDCSAKSGCIAIEPRETLWGRKRQIDQSACNQDLSCVEGFCPAIVTVDAPEGPSALRERAPARELPEPDVKWSASAPDWNVVLAGVGGAGVVTLAQTLGVAAHLSGLDVSTIDQTGLAQKGGAVTSHLRLAREPGQIKAARVPDGECDALIASDLSTACLPETMGKLKADRTRAVACSEVMASSEVIRDPGASLKAEPMMRSVEEACLAAWFGAARSVAMEEFGEEIAVNFMLAGRAWQMGLLPIPRAAIHQAIELNGAATAMNVAAFERGRSLAVAGSADTRFVETVGLERLRSSLKGPSWEEQAERARSWGGVEAESAHGAFKKRLAELESGSGGPARKALERVGAARAALALRKDEYEVARLHVEGTSKGAEREAGSAAGLAFHLAPPVWPGSPAAKGRKVKVPGWIGWPTLRALRALAWLRGTALDPFARSSERRAEIEDERAFERAVERLGALLARAPRPEPERAALWTELARLGQVRGFGAVRQASREDLGAKREAFFERLGA